MKNKVGPEIGVGARGRGRPKGSQNKTTRTAKDAIAYAAEQIGGQDRLVDWIKSDADNERIFWSTIYPKLLPLQVNGPGENGEHALKVTIQRFSE